MTVETHLADQKLIEHKLRSGSIATKVGLVELFETSPLKGLDLDFSRNASMPLDVDLDR